MASPSILYHCHSHLCCCHTRLRRFASPKRRRPLSSKKSKLINQLGRRVSGEPHRLIALCYRLPMIARLKWHGALVDRQPPLGWRCISPERNRASEPAEALRNIQRTFATAYELPLGEMLIYRFPKEHGSIVIGLGWFSKNSRYWYYAYMSRAAIELGNRISVFLYDNDRVRVFPGVLHDRPMRKLTRKRQHSSFHEQIIGERLRTARLRAQLTQKDLASRLSRISTDKKLRYRVSTLHQLVSRVERGEHIRFPRLLLNAVEAVLGPLKEHE
jgi:hypothetical protein